MYSSQVTVLTVDVSIMTPPADGGRGGTVLHVTMLRESRLTLVTHTQPP